MRFGFLSKQIGAALLAVSFILGFSLSVSEAQNAAQKKLMARRAAKVDALRNLTELVYGLQIDSSTTVRDFVTQSDRIKARVSAVIQGARETDYRELPDGTAEVTVEITLGPVEDILGRRIYYDRRIIEATGYGAPSGETPAASGSTTHYASSVTAKGNGIEPNDPEMSPAEKALMAKRAAKLDAMRNLAEEVYGVRLTSNTTVRDFVTQSDEMRSKVHTFMQGAKVISEKQLPDGSYQVEVEVDTEPLRNMFSTR